MATIGVYDWDLLRWRSPIVFNLELMKIAYYHKVYLKNYVKMPIREIDFDQFKAFFVWKDYDDLDSFGEWTFNNKVIMGGLAITNGVHVPLDKDIEICHSDTSIYKNTEFIYKKVPTLKSIYDRFMNGQHLRLISGNKILKNWEKQIDLEKSTRNIFLHDKDLVLTEDVKSALNKIKYSTWGESASIGMKFPITINNREDFTFWASLRKINDLNSTNITCELLDSDLGLIAIKYPQVFNFILPDNFEQSIDFIPKLYHLLIQAHYLAEYRSEVEILYPKRSLSEDWQDFIFFYNKYLSYVRKRAYKIQITPYKFCRNYYIDLSREEKIDLFNFLKQYPSIFDLMFCMEYVNYKNKQLSPHMYTPFEIEKMGGYYDQGRYYAQNRAEQFNYAEITEPKRIYIEQRYCGSAKGEQKLTVDLW